MRKLFSYLFIAQMLFAFGSKTFVVLNWKINQAYITEKYCINKDQPMLNCNGKCYLSKQLKALEQQEKEERDQYPSPKPLVESTNFAWNVEDLAIYFSFEIDSFNTIKGNSKPISWYEFISAPIDHPPQL